MAPESGIMDRFAIREIQRTFPSDSLQSSHPVSIEVQHPDEIGQIFDSISYGKGASIIRMMANFLGIETFNQGITNYLKEHRYGNARQDDLWESLTKVAMKQKTLQVTNFECTITHDHTMDVTNFGNLNPWHHIMLAEIN